MSKHAQAEPDLSRCSEAHFSIGLYEHEHAGVQDDPATWPPDAVRIMEREIARWRERNPEAEIVCTRTAVVRCSLDVRFYHSPRPPSPQRPARAAPAPSPAGAAPSCQPCGG